MDFLTQNPLYVVAIISVVIWFGIFVFLLLMEKKVNRLEDVVRNDNDVNRI